MHNKWLAIVIVLILTILPVLAQGRELPTNLCGEDDVVTDIEAIILADIEAIHAGNPYILMDRSPQCLYVIGMFQVATAPDDERLIIAWDVNDGGRVIEYIRPKLNFSQVPQFLWNPSETEVVIGSVPQRIGLGNSPAQHPFHLWKLDTDEGFVLQCGVENCLSPLFRRIIWDDTHNWLWTGSLYGMVAYDRDTGYVTYSYENPPWEGYISIWGHSVVFSDDMSHVIIYFDTNSSAGLTVWDINQYQAYPVYIDDFVSRHGSIALSPDNRYLAIGFRAIRVWDLQNLEPAYEDRFPIYRHEGPFANIGFLQFVDNTTIETRSADGVQLWDLHTGELIESASP